MNHIPGYLISSSHPLVVPDGPFAFNFNAVAFGCNVFIELIRGNFDRLLFFKPAGGFFYNSKSHGKNFVENSFNFIVD